MGTFLERSVAVLIPLAAGPAPLAFAMMAVAQLLGDRFLTVYFITQASLQQQLIPPRFLGRATARIPALESGIGPVGALLAGALATLTSTWLHARGRCGRQYHRRDAAVGPPDATRRLDRVPQSQP